MLFNLHKVYIQAIEELERKEFDFIIIGSGPAGITLCNEILKKKKKKYIDYRKRRFIKK